ncbi:hypothetical protein Ancab_016628, partial [Ancistrocladus abbreviatus]
YGPHNWATRHQSLGGPSYFCSSINVTFEPTNRTPEARRDIRHRVYLESTFFALERIKARGGGKGAAISVRA